MSIKISHRSVQENEVIESDRVELIAAANHLISTMVLKQVLPAALSSVPIDTDHTKAEETTYHAALQFLFRQFECGHSDSETVVKRVETETSREVDTVEPDGRGDAEPWSCLICGGVPDISEFVNGCALWSCSCGASGTIQEQGTPA